MVSLRELSYYFTGALRLARLDRGGLDHFDNTVAAFWRSFQAAIYIAPVFAYATIVQLAEVTVRSGPTKILMVESLMYVIRWLLFPFVMLGITAALDRRHRYCQYVAAYNWSSLIWATALLAVLLIHDVDLLSDRLTTALFWVVQMLMFAYVAYIARVGLDVSVVAAIGIVVVDFVLSVMMNALTASMLGFRYASG